MNKQKTEYAIISNAVDILSVQCAGNRDKIIDLLTGYLWDEEEAGGIKESTGKWKFEIENPLLDQLESGPWPSFVQDMKKNAKKLPEPIKEWPCAVCGKAVADPNWFMKTTLCEEHIGSTGKEYTAGPQPWMCECGHMNNMAWLRCDNCRRHRPDNEIS